jgi:hypothetical protein
MVLRKGGNRERCAHVRKDEQIGGCTRNCHREVSSHVPLGVILGRRDEMSIREPGDLPSKSPVCRPGRAERTVLRRGDTFERAGPCGVYRETGSDILTAKNPLPLVF